MKNYIYLFVLLIITFLLYFQPNIIINFSNSFVGRMVLLVLILISAFHSTLLSVLIAVVFIILTELYYSNTNIENMVSGTTQGNVSAHDTGQGTGQSTGQSIASSIVSGSTSVPANVQDMVSGPVSGSDKFSTSDKLQSFRNKFCKITNSETHLVDKDGASVTIEEFNKKYPGLSFSNGIVCDPCNATCKFSITDSFELLTQDENLRPKDSNLDAFDNMRAGDSSSQNAPEPVPNSGLLTKKNKKLPQTEVN